MAPRVPRDYHSAGDPNSYSPRTRAKRGEGHLPRAQNVSGTTVNEKEGFFRSIGLQMKRYQYEYSTPAGVHGTRKINVPCEVKLRDCNVVVLGATCEICGISFKCVTDVNVHAAWKHCRYQANDAATNELSRAKGNSRACEVSSKTVERATVLAARRPGSKPNGTLRLTLRIGDEVVAQRAMKRKHLRINNRVDIATQTEFTHGVNELIMKRCDSAVPRIDLPVLDNSPCSCCTSGMHVVNSTNQYLAGNIVASKDTDRVGSVAKKGSPVLDRLTESCATSTVSEINGDRDSPPNVLFKSNVTQTVEQNDTAGMFDLEDSNPDGLSTQRDHSVVRDSYDNSWVTSSNSVRNINVGIVREDKGVLPEQTVQSPEKDVNGNETPSSAPFKKQNSQNSGVVSSVVVPVIVPIIVSNNHTPAANKIPHRPPTASQQRNPTPPVATERNADDDVQEVLRIVRGHAISEGINHESPNRSEQEMLVRDAIRDMLRMEEQGWHLLEKDIVEPSWKRRRVPAKSDTRNGAANEDPARRKRRATAQPSLDGNFIRSASNERYVSNAKELFAKAQKPSQNGVCITDNVKENVMICNGNISVPSEALRCYEINYCNDTFEINNNTEMVQESVSRFLVPCSGGTENKGNRPAVIDLVNDTDE